MPDKIYQYPNYSQSETPTDQPYGQGISYFDAIDSAKEEGFTTGKTSVADYSNQSTKSWSRKADPNGWIFRYGLFFDDFSNLEDPTLLGYTFEIDDNNSPLLADASEPYSAMAFIDKYQGMPEIAARRTMLEEFQKQIKMFFRSQESTKIKESDYPYVKSHYINSVSGMDKLAKKFIEYGEDLLTINMHEDVTMHSQYLAQLYNNIAYSYLNGKTLIPENLLRFNLTIKISEIRNFKTVAKEILSASDTEKKSFVVNVNSSQLVYTLYDCNFMFFDSQNHGNEISMAGVDASTVKAKELELSIKFKYVNRFFKSTFLEDLSNSTNSRIVINDGEIDPTSTLDSGAYFGDKTEIAPPTIQTPDTSQQTRDKNNYLAGNTFDTNKQGDKATSGYLDKIKAGIKTEAANKLTTIKQNGLNALNTLKNSAISELNKEKNKYLAELRNKRGELVNSLIGKIKTQLGVQEVYPKNVYYGYNPSTDFKGKLSTALGGDISKTLKNFLGSI